MALRYDDIKKGRRWDWDKLQDPEERRRREQERREQDPEYQKTKSLLKQIEERRQKELDQGREDWKKVKSKLRWRLGIVIVLLVGLMVWQLLQFFDYRRTFEEKLRDSSQIVSQRLAYSAYGDPADAFTSWRSAWARNDLQGVIRSESPRRLKRLFGDANAPTRLAEMHRKGLTSDWQRVALQFDSPEVVRLPERPYQAQELAVFKSNRIVLRTRQSVIAGRGGEVTRDQWIAAFAWQPDQKEWRLEELRPAQYWDDGWNVVPQIVPPAEYLRRKAEKMTEERGGTTTPSGPTEP